MAIIEGGHIRLRSLIRRIESEMAEAWSYEGTLGIVASVQPAKERARNRLDATADGRRIRGR